MTDKQTDRWTDGWSDGGRTTHGQTEFDYERKTAKINKTNKQTNKHKTNREKTTQN